MVVDFYKLKCVSIILLSAGCGQNGRIKLSARYHLGNSETVHPLSTEATVAPSCIMDAGLSALVNNSFYSPRCRSFNRIVCLISNTLLAKTGFDSLELLC
jgi:hypothetical protein